MTESQSSGSQAFAIRGVSDQQLIEMLDLDGPVRFEDEVQGYSGRRNRSWFRFNASAPRSVPKIGQRQIAARKARKWAKRKWSRTRPVARWGALILVGLLVGSLLGWLTLRPRPTIEVVADAALVDPVLTRSEIAAADHLQQFELSSESARSLVVARRKAFELEGELGSLRQPEESQQVWSELSPTADLLPVPSLKSILSPLDEALDQGADREASGDESQNQFLADPFAKLAVQQQHAADQAADRPADNEFSKLVAESDQKVTDQSLGNPATTVAGDERPSSDQAVVSQLEGRLLLEGGDLGVRLIYTEGVFISSELFSQLADHVKEDLQAAEIRFTAEFELVEPRDVQVRLAVSPDRRPQSVRVDGQAVAFPALRSTCELKLDRGFHRIEWSFANEPGRPLSFRVRDAVSLKRIPLVPLTASPRTGSSADQADPVADWLTVKITDTP